MPGLLVRRVVASLTPLLALAACAQSAPPRSTPDPAAAEITNVERSGAREVVDDPESRLTELHVAPGDPDTRVALWSRCASEACDVRDQAVALTVDGFRSRTIADATWSDAAVRIARDGDVVVLDYPSRLTIHVVSSTGEVTSAEMSRDVAPVGADEVVGGVDYEDAQPIFWATDTTTAQAHAVPVPDDTRQLIQTDSGQLRAMTARRSYAWSDDGGVTWIERDDAVDRNLGSSLVRSTDDTHVVVGGGDGATLFPFNQIRRLDAEGTWSVTDVPGDPTAYVGPQAVLPDGRFLVAVDAWSDHRRLGQLLRGTPPGIYVSDGADWSAYARVESGAPFGTPKPMQPMVTDIDVSDSGTLITAFGPDQTTAWTSTDLGVTWHEMRVR